MAGGAEGAVGMRLNIMTALYLPILGYAMATFDLNPDALIIKSDNLQAHAVPVERSVPVGDMFSASIYYELVPTQAQKERLEEMDEAGAAKAEDSHAKGAFEPKVIIDKDESPEGMYYDSVDKKIYFNTANVFRNEPADTYRKEVSFSARIEAQTAKGVSYFREVDQSFTVFRPTIEVKSNITPRLLANCKNSLSFSVPGVSTTAITLREKFTGQNYSSNSLTWSPTQDTAVVEVFRETGSGQKNKIGERGFKVTDPPLPVLGLRQPDDNEFLTAEDRVDLFNDFELVVEADENFLNEFPNDANYRVNGMKVEITRSGLVPIEEEFGSSALNRMLDLKNESNGEFIYRFSLFDLTNNPQGSGVSVFVRDLDRVNYAGKRIPIDLNDVSSQFTYKAQ